MKKLFFFLIAAVIFFAACNTSTKNDSDKIKQDSIAKADSVAIIEKKKTDSLAEIEKQKMLLPEECKKYNFQECMMSCESLSLLFTPYSNNISIERRGGDAMAPLIKESGTYEITKFDKEYKYIKCTSSKNENIILKYSIKKKKMTDCITGGPNGYYEFESY
jgi:hypothetical protein